MTVAGRSAVKAVASAKKLSAEGHVAEVDSIRSAVDAAADKMGGLDLLVNCIGMNREQKIDEITEEAFDEIYRANLRSAMFIAQSAARHQVAGGRGGKQVHMLSVRSQLGMRASATRPIAPPRARRREALAGAPGPHPPGARGGGARRGGSHLLLLLVGLRLRHRAGALRRRRHHRQQIAGL